MLAILQDAHCRQSGVHEVNNLMDIHKAMEALESVLGKVGFIKIEVRRVKRSEQF